MLTPCSLKTVTMNGGIQTDILFFLCVPSIVFCESDPPKAKRLYLGPPQGKREENNISTAFISE